MVPKFRAFYDGEMLYNASKVGNALYWDDGDYFDLLAFKYDTPPVMMQCIGYADINNIDIYEGDIIKDEYDRIMLVERRRGCLCFKALNETNFVYATDIHQWFDADCQIPPIIITNVYQIPLKTLWLKSP